MELFLADFHGSFPPAPLVENDTCAVCKHRLPKGSATTWQTAALWQVPSSTRGLTIIILGDRVRPVCSSCCKARHALRCEYRPPPLKLRPSIYSSEDPSNVNGNNNNRKKTHGIIIDEANKANATSETTSNSRGAFRSKSFPSADSTTPIFHAKCGSSPATMASHFQLHALSIVRVCVCGIGGLSC
jgi:hypothetical protein